MRWKVLPSVSLNTRFFKRSIQAHLPMNQNNFRKEIEHKRDFVDKSLFIKDIIDNKGVKVSVISRPQGFGKTWNMSMLRHFLAPEVDGKPTQNLFNHLRITQAGNEYQSYQGRYPVIFISFKGIKGHTYKVTYNNLCKLISRVYREHQSVLASSHLSRYEKKVFESILKEQAREVDIQASLSHLTRILHLHYRVAPWLLIDDYDMPILASYGDKDHQPFIYLMQNLLGSALKSNAHLYRAVVTGVMPAAQLLIDANNLVVYLPSSQDYGERFGFTEEEAQNLLRKTGLGQQLKEIQNYYYGYHMGEKIVYNPLSIVNCIAKNGQLSPYGINAANASLISDLLFRSSQSLKARLELLLRDNRIEYIIDQPMSLDDLFKGEPAIWNLLLTTGYLTAVSRQWTSHGPSHVLKIPNQEFRHFYQQTVQRWHSQEYVAQDFQNGFKPLTFKGNLFCQGDQLEEDCQMTVQEGSHKDSKDTIAELNPERLIDSFKEQLQSIVLLIRSNKVSEADRKCSFLIQALEPLTSHVEIHHLLSEAYVIKANFLSRIPYEGEHQQALALYEKALKLTPDSEPAKKGKENLLILRGESSHVKIVGTLYSESFFFNPRPYMAWVDELKAIKLLWSQNKGSEALRKCDALIEEIEISPDFSEIKTKEILCEAYIFKGDFLRLTGALEKQAQQAFNYYHRALEISPNHPAALEGIENLKIIRGESTRTQVEEPDPEASYFKY
jgi:tetratricopeptide (TPR) repeat protein